MFAIKASSQIFDWVLYIGHQKYWNFQSEVKVPQIIAIVTTRGVFYF